MSLFNRRTGVPSISAKNSSQRHQIAGSSIGGLGFEMCRNHHLWFEKLQSLLRFRRSVSFRPAAHGNQHYIGRARSRFVLQCRIGPATPPKCKILTPACCHSQATLTPNRLPPSRSFWVQNPLNPQSVRVVSARFVQEAGIAGKSVDGPLHRATDC